MGIIKHHNVIDVGMQADDLIRAGMGNGHVHGNKGNIGYADGAALCRGDKPVSTRCIARQDRGKQADQFRTTNGGAKIKPVAIAVDRQTKITAAVRHQTAQYGIGRFSIVIVVAHGPCPLVVQPGRRIIPGKRGEGIMNNPNSSFPGSVTPPPLSTERQDQLMELVSRAHRAVASVIFGQDQVINESLVTLLAGGHVLLVGVPGLAKTRLVQAMGQVLGLETRRIQFTPDLMPADILGSEILDTAPEGHRWFRFVPGPVFTQLLMADEVNRAGPRTQSALLQAMQEHEVSIAGQTHRLPAPFHVLATQNPIEQEGTYPLPEAQLDRFMMQVDVGYPDLDAERQMLIATTGTTTTHLHPVMTAEDLMAAQDLVRRMPVGTRVVESILALVRNGRPESSNLDMVRRAVAWGPGPRASQALTMAVRARALLDGRLAPSEADVTALAAPVLRHRMALTFAARADGITVDAVVRALVADLETPAAAA